MATPKTQIVLDMGYTLYQALINDVDNKIKYACSIAKRATEEPKDESEKQDRLSAIQELARILYVKKISGVSKEILKHLGIDDCGQTFAKWDFIKKKGERISVF